MKVDYNTYTEQQFTCKRCGWSGSGAALGHGDFHEHSMIGDLECPKCFELVAYWQAPLINKNNEQEGE